MFGHCNMVDNLSIVILSAGKGTRMRSDKAKVLHNIAGKPMLYHIIKEAKKLSSDITVVVGHQSERVKESINLYFKDIKFLEQDIEYFSGTGGALMKFQPEKSRTLILNGDMPLITSSDLEPFFSIDSDIVMTSIELENPTGYGRVIIKNDEVLKIVEEKDASEIEKAVKTVNAGVYLLGSELLKKYISNLSNKNAQKEFYLTDIIEMAKKDDRIVRSILVSEKSFRGVNSRLDLSKAEEIFLKRVKTNIMKNGTSIHLPDTVYIEDSVQFIGECEVEQNVTIIGETTIINSVIKAGSIIEDSKIENSTIGVLAHIRPKSSILDSKIGNFVEVKKSNLKGVKAGHLSYIGDAEIGENTNIGAGVITANYDGKNKYKTKIGKNVFIGSDSQLIAPINIGDDIMIGAGSTVPSNSSIPNGSLVISRANLRIIKNFFYKFFRK